MLNSRFSLKPDKIRPVSRLTHFLHVPLKRLHLTYTLCTLPQVNLLQTQKNKTPTLRKDRRVKGMVHRETGRKRVEGRGEVVFLGSKAILLPSTLVHSLHATLASGGMGVSLSLVPFTCQSKCYQIQWAPWCGVETPSQGAQGMKSPPVCACNKTTITAWIVQDILFLWPTDLRTTLMIICTDESSSHNCAKSQVNYVYTLGYDFLFTLLMQSDWQKYRHTTESISNCSPQKTLWNGWTLFHGHYGVRWT